MAEYVIEIRFAGYSREYVRGVVYAAARRFGIKGVTRNNAVPPIPLFGPIKCKDDKRIMKALIDATWRHKIVTYKVKGFSHYRGERKWLLFNQHMNSIYLDLEPSEELKQIRRDLGSALGSCRQDASSPPSSESRFFADLPFGDLGDKFDRVWAYMKENEDPNIVQRLLRITAIKNGRMMCEYDLIENKLSLREQSMSGKYLSRTLDALSQSTQGLQLLVLKRKKRTSRQTTLTADRSAQWLSKIISPVMHDLRRSHQEWMPKLIKPALSGKPLAYRQATLPPPEQQAPPKGMQPLFAQKTKKTYTQTTLAPANTRPWIAAIIQPAIAKSRRQE